MKKKLIMAAALLSGVCFAQTIFVVGDSTAYQYSQEQYPMAGWGQKLAEHAKPGVKIDNRALGGYSTIKFYTSGNWEKMRGELKEGDFVLIQFGHNDQKSKNRPDNYASADIIYPAFLKQFIVEVREKRANPVLLTSIARRLYKNGTIEQSHGKYPQVVRDVARETDTPLIDANVLTMDWLNREGKENPDNTKQYFTWCAPGEFPRYPKGLKDNSHTSVKGAEAIALMIIRDAQKQKLPLGDCFLATENKQ